MTTTTSSTRFKKLDWLLKTCTSEFIKDSIFLTELVGWMSEDEFNAFHENICRNWNIQSEFAEEDDNEFIITDDEMIPA